MVELTGFLQKKIKTWPISGFKIVPIKKQVKQSLMSFEKKMAWVKNFIPSQGITHTGKRHSATQEDIAPLHSTWKL